MSWVKVYGFCKMISPGNGRRKWWTFTLVHKATIGVRLKITLYIYIYIYIYNFNFIFFKRIFYDEKMVWK